MSSVPQPPIDVEPNVKNCEKTIESVLESPTKDTIEETKIIEEVNVKEATVPVSPEKPEKIDAMKVSLELSPQVFGLAKEVKAPVKVEKIVQNEKSHSPESSEESDDDEEDVRQLEGRTVSAKGQGVCDVTVLVLTSFFLLFNLFCVQIAIFLQIDRASAANVRRSKEEITADPDEEDGFGYTMSKYAISLSFLRKNENNKLIK